MRNYSLCILIVILTSCSASWHIRTAMRKDPSLFHKDTIVRVDTVWKEVVKVDTLFKYKFDTVEYWKDSVFVKYHYSVQDSLVYLEVDCPDNEVITKTEIVTEIIKIKPTLTEKLESGVYFIIVFGLLLILVYFLLRLIWKKYKARTI